MSEPNQTPPAEAPGHGHTVEIKLPNGQTRVVPWGFTTAKKEAEAAKKHGIEIPGTTATE